jgi:hypothetical protein
MEAYRHVNDRVRRDFELVLQSWKHPPQGSRDPRPVLPPEITGRIENAVVKFRSMILPDQQAPPFRQLPGRPGVYRNSPAPPAHISTPPGVNAGFKPPAVNGTPNPVDIAELISSLQPRTGTPTFSVAPPYQPPPAVRSPIPSAAMPVPQTLPLPYMNTSPDYRSPYSPVPAPTITQHELQNEVREVLNQAGIQKLLEPHNQDLQGLISTLEQLKVLLNSQQFGAPHLLQMQSELEKIKSRIQNQLANVMGTVVSTPPPNLPFNPPTASPYPPISTPPPIINYTPMPTSAPAPLPPGLSQPIAPQFNLAAILGSLQPPQSSTPNPAPAPPSLGNEFLDQLRAAGLLGPSSAAEVHTVPGPSAGKAFSGPLDQDSITKA